VAPVAGGDGFNDAQRASIDRAIRDAEIVCRFEFSVYVGRFEGEPRLFAERLHTALVAPARSILIAVDPAARVVEVVTGEQVRWALDDTHVRLAVAEMQSEFAHDDLCGGIVRGINMLASSARRPPTLHA
jgi:hypothetical protein